MRKLILLRFTKMILACCCIYYCSGYTDSSSELASVEFNQALAEYQQGTLSGYYKAKIKWEKALRLWQKSKNLNQESITRNFLCLTYFNLADYSQALNCYQQLLQISRYLKEQKLEASSLNGIARVQSKLGEYQNALENLDLALAIWQRIKFKTGKLSTLNEIAVVYFDLGEYEQAINYYNKAQDLAKDSGNQANVAAIYHNLAQVYLEQGELEKAHKGDEQALNLYESLILQLNNQVSPEIIRAKAAILNNLGYIDSKNQNFSAALTNYKNSLQLWQNLGNQSGIASTVNNLGDLYLLQNDSKNALDYYQQALAIRQRIKDRLKETISLYSIALVYRNNENLSKAKEFIERAINLIENLRTQVTNDDLRTSFLASKQDYYRFYIDLLMQLNKKYPQQGWDAKALYVSEKSKARSLLDILARSSGKITNGISPSLLEQKEFLERSIANLESQQINLSDTTYITKLKRNYQEVLKKIAIQYPHYSNLNQPNILNLSQIQKLLDSNTILLEYALGEKQSYLYLVSSHSLKAYELPAESTIEKSVKEFRQSFLFPAKRIRATLAVRSGYALKKLILPDNLELGNKRILIVSDGALHYVPFSALSNSEKINSNQGYLIDQHELISIPSASVLAVIRQELAHRKSAPNPLAVFADPVFSNNDDRLKFLGFEKSPPLAIDLMKSARESGVVFNRLPFTQTEAQKIVALLPGKSSLQQIGFQANRNNVFNSQLKQYRLIHFASHGLLNSQNPQLSGLVLSLFDSKGHSVNGFLRLSEIFNLRLPADLIVLSACQTGLGKIIKGEGMIGLTRGFMYAGSPRVVVSLWSVDDQATSVLMSKFYQAILQNRLTPSAALRQAQIATKSDPNFSSPYYWAAFTLQGEWR